MNLSNMSSTYFQYEYSIEPLNKSGIKMLGQYDLNINRILFFTKHSFKSSLKFNIIVKSFK